MLFFVFAFNEYNYVIIIFISVVYLLVKYFMQGLLNIIYFNIKVNKKEI